MAFYPAAVNELFQKPRNAGVIERTAARGQASSFMCGAALRITLRIETPGYRVADARFQATGCGYLIAAASLLTEMIQGLRLAEAESVAATPELCDALIIKHCVNVPSDRRHCIALCREALQDALRNYRQSALTAWQGADSYICVCFSVAEKTIQETIAHGALHTIAEVTAKCNAGAGCGSCRSLIQDLLDEHWSGLA